MSSSKKLTNHLISGDPLEPMASDLIAQVKQITFGQKAPAGWRMLSTNNKYSQIGRVVQRYEIEVEL